MIAYYAVIGALVGVAVGFAIVKWVWHPNPKIGVKTADIDLNDPRYVIDDVSARAGFVCKNLDGMGWYEKGHIELPPENHRCWTQTWAEMTDFTFVRRCPCGAISMNDPSNNDVYWMDRNETRKSR
jgi:hypothetical protein